MSNNFGVPDEDWKFIVQMVKETKGSVTYLGPTPCPKPISLNRFKLSGDDAHRLPGGNKWKPIGQFTKREGK